MNSKVSFAFLSQGPDPTDDARRIVNPGEGLELDLLRGLLLEHFPKMEPPADLTPEAREAFFVDTNFRVLFFERYQETPFSHPRIRALVDVFCAGNFVNLWPAVEGVYDIRIEGEGKQPSIILSFQRVSDASKFQTVKIGDAWKPPIAIAVEPQTASAYSIPSGDGYELL